MSEDHKNIKIRVRSGESEAEVEAPLSKIREAIGLIPDVVAKLPPGAPERRIAVAVPHQEGSPTHIHERPAAVAQSTAPSSLPVVTIEKGDSLSDVISKFFADQWGRSPRKLMEVREALQSYGLNYPKQSVAVALLRLAKASKIRRFKGEGGEYVYTVSTGSVRVQGPGHAMGMEPVPEAEAPPVEAVEEPEEQLNLDAPSTN